jgi:hypothetical protein
MPDPNGRMAGLIIIPIQDAAFLVHDKLQALFAGFHRFSSIFLNQSQVPGYGPAYGFGVILLARFSRSPSSDRSIDPSTDCFQTGRYLAGFAGKSRQAKRR